MSVVKLSNGKSSAVMLRYLVYEREVKVGHDIEPKRYLAFDSLGLQDIKRIEAAWRMTRQSFGKDSQLRYHHASISLDSSDAKSRHMKDSELVHYGKSFMERFAPGHDYAIAIHRIPSTPTSISYGTPLTTKAA